MKNVWLERKQHREFMATFPSVIGGVYNVPTQITLDTAGIPQNITVNWGDCPSITPGWGTMISSAQWDGPGLPPSITVTTQDICPVIIDGIQLPKEINVSTFNQGVC